MKKTILFALLCSLPPMVLAQADEWMECANEGDPICQYELGWIYTDGQGVAQNDEEAARWFRAAAKQGHADAQYNLGYGFALGKGVTQSNKEAVRWFRAAAEQGHASAQYNLGIAYSNGKGRQNDGPSIISCGSAV